MSKTAFVVPGSGSHLETVDAIEYRTQNNEISGIEDMHELYLENGYMAKVLLGEYPGSVLEIGERPFTIVARVISPPAGIILADGYHWGLVEFSSDPIQATQYDEVCFHRSGVISTWVENSQTIADYHFEQHEKQENNEAGQ